MPSQNIIEEFTDGIVLNEDGSQTLMTECNYCKCIIFNEKVDKLQHRKNFCIYKYNFIYNIPSMMHEAISIKCLVCLKNFSSLTKSDISKHSEQCKVNKNFLANTRIQSNQKMAVNKQTSASTLNTHNEDIPRLTPKNVNVLQNVNSPSPNVPKIITVKNVKTLQSTPFTINPNQRRTIVANNKQTDTSTPNLLCNNIAPKILQEHNNPSTTVGSTTTMNTLAQQNGKKIVYKTFTVKFKQINSGITHQNQGSIPTPSTSQNAASAANNRGDHSKTKESNQRTTIVAINKQAATLTPNTQQDKIQQIASQHINQSIGVISTSTPSTANVPNTLSKKTTNIQLSQGPITRSPVDRPQFSFKLVKMVKNNKFFKFGECNYCKMLVVFECIDEHREQCTKEKPYVHQKNRGVSVNVPIANHREECTKPNTQEMSTPVDITSLDSSTNIQQDILEIPTEPIDTTATNVTSDIDQEMQDISNVTVNNTYMNVSSNFPKNLLAIQSVVEPSDAAISNDDIRQEMSPLTVSDDETNIQVEMVKIPDVPEPIRSDILFNVQTVHIPTNNVHELPNSVENDDINPQLLSKIIKYCFICNEADMEPFIRLHNTVSAYSQTRIYKFVCEFLGGPSSRIPKIEKDIICSQCLREINEYDYAYVQAQQFRKNLSGKIIKTEAHFEMTKNNTNHSND